MDEQKGEKEEGLAGRKGSIHIGEAICIELVSVCGGRHVEMKTTPVPPTRERIGLIDRVHDSRLAREECTVG